LVFFYFHAHSHEFSLAVFQYTEFYCPVVLNDCCSCRCVASYRPWSDMTL